jgi:hypothetical protein
LGGWEGGDNGVGMLGATIWVCQFTTTTIALTSSTDKLI